MKLSEELQNLERLRWNGTLTEQEFVQAKAVVLGTPPPTPPTTPNLTCTLAELERAWAEERSQYTLPTMWGEQVEPTRETAQAIRTESNWIGGGTLLACGFFLPFLFVVYGILAMLFGATFVVAGLGFWIGGYQQAQKHAKHAEKLRQGWAVYEERRAQLLRQLGQ